MRITIFYFNLRKLYRLNYFFKIDYLATKSLAFKINDNISKIFPNLNL